MTDDDGLAHLLGRLAGTPEVRPDFPVGARVGGHFIILEHGRRVPRAGRAPRARRRARGGRRARGEPRAASSPAAGAPVPRARRAPPRGAVREVGAIDGHGVFIAMERVEGGTLRDVLHDEARGRDARLRAVIEAGHGLLAAHAVGLVHRDFKPENVLIGTDGRVRVSDFGLALDAPRDVVGARAPLDLFESLGFGTPGDMPPEQLRGERVDARADQWAFAIVCYEALYAHNPFSDALGSATTVEDALEVLASGESRVALPTTDASGAVVPARLRKALEVALAPEPGARHASLAPLIDALEATLGGASPSRRGRVALGASAALLAAGGWWAVAAEPPCERAGEILQDDWQSKARPRIEAEGPSPRLARALALMDDYAARWRAELEAACAAEEAPTGPNEASSTDRRLCLRDLERDFRAAASVLTTSSTMTDVLRGPSRLFAPASCAGAAFARARPPEPATAQAGVEATRRAIAEARPSRTRVASRPL